MRHNMLSVLSVSTNLDAIKNKEKIKIKPFLALNEAINTKCSLRKLLRKWVNDQLIRQVIGCIIDSTFGVCLHYSSTEIASNDWTYWKDNLRLEELNHNDNVVIPTAVIIPLKRTWRRCFFIMSLPPSSLFFCSQAQCKKLLIYL